mmetsp:Transcript_28583/g.57144  ORF Transcript_28583/g.57144 Transcript_28583/m.57144 type:complete len:201 (-) Transcript_28583:996-1598(-)
MKKWRRRRLRTAMVLHGSRRSTAGGKRCARATANVAKNSRHIDVDAFLLRVSGKKLPVDQSLNLRLDQRRLWLEKRALPEHLVKQRNVVEPLPRLHDPDNRSINDVFPLDWSLCNRRFCRFLFLLDQTDDNLYLFVGEGLVDRQHSGVDELLVVAAMLEQFMLGQCHRQHLPVALLSGQLCGLNELAKRDFEPLVEAHQR